MSVSLLQLSTYHSHCSCIVAAAREHMWTTSTSISDAHQGQSVVCLNKSFRQKCDVRVETFLREQGTFLLQLKSFKQNISSNH